MLNHNNKKKVLIKSLIKQEKENHFQIQNLLPKKKKNPLSSLKKKTSVI